MSKYDLNTWDEFEPAINKIKAKYPTVRILFRGGDADAENKHLKTTLERFCEKSKEKWTLKRYSQLIWSFAPEIESFLGRKMDLPSWPEMEKELESYDPSKKYMPFPPKLYSYFIYLRQHGFPSPLLDWTSSPFIAAYFAFSKPKIKEDKERKNDKNQFVEVCSFCKRLIPCWKTGSGKNAIFVFIECPNCTKWTDESGFIKFFSQNVNTDKRHFLQQSQYSISLKKSIENNDWEFIPHSIFYQEYDEDEEYGRQDLLIRITLPLDERIKVLSSLDQYNLNQYSLFQTEDDLIKTITFREIEKAE